MAHIDLAIEHVVRLTNNEFRLLGLAMAAALSGEPIRRQEDRTEMARLNLKLQELRANRLREAAENTRHSLEQATRLEQEESRKEASTEDQSQ